MLAANADPEVLRRHDAGLDAAYEQARQDGDLTLLVRTVHRWWLEADAWRDPQAQREFLARIERYQREGPPPPERRITREEIRAQYGVSSLYRWELDDPAQPVSDALRDIKIASPRSPRGQQPVSAPAPSPERSSLMIDSINALHGD